MRRRVRFQLLVPLLMCAAGCYTSYSSVEPGAVEGLRAVRVTTVDGDVKTLRDPVVEADSIKGLSHDTVAVFALDRVSELETRESYVGGTAVITVFAAAAVLVCFVLVYKLFDME